MTNPMRAMLALLLSGCGLVESNPDGITEVSWCECVTYRAGCGQPVASECHALTDVEQLNASWWGCVSAVVHSGPLDQAGRCELPRPPLALEQAQALPLPRPPAQLP